MKTKLKLGSKDAAIIIRENGNYEACIPEQPPEVKSHDSSLLVAALACALDDEATMAVIWDNFARRSKRVNPEHPNLIVLPGGEG
jgi:hypothetical protein